MDRVCMYVCIYTNTHENKKEKEETLASLEIEEQHCESVIK